MAANKALKREIAERAVAEEKRLSMEEQYSQAQKVESIGRLAGGVAHDLNNLLVPIIGYSELFSKDFEEDDSRKKRAGHILEAGLRARDLVQQLLAFSRKQALEYQVINLNDVIQGFQELLRRTIREDIEFRFNLADKLSDIKADVGQLEQVLMNICVNAQDAMVHGGTLIFETEQVEIESLNIDSTQKLFQGDYILLTLQDTGTGMDQETKNQIFEPFFSTKGEFGNGLGLATVYGIVTQHGGGIQVFSEPDAGSIFKIYMPVFQDVKEQQKKLSSRVLEKQIEAEILFVEDDENVRELANDILTMEGYQIQTASNGRDALAILQEKSRSIDLLMTDVIMPNMNGRELYDQALEIMPDLKVIFMSGYTDDIILNSGVKNEIVTFLQKPYTIESLTSKVSETLNS